MTMRERLVRVITTAKFQGRFTVDHADDLLKNFLRELSTPTQDMIEYVRAGGTDLGGYDMGGGDGDCHQCDPGEVFAAMINAIREGK